MGNSKSSYEEDFKAVGGFSEYDSSQSNDAVSHIFSESGLGTQVCLYISGENLADLDVGANDFSDPFCVVFMLNKANQLIEIGRTEVICNCLSPSFVTPVNVTYRFEEVQELVFQMYDVETHGIGFDNANIKNLRLDQQELIGQCKIHLSMIMGAMNSTSTGVLTLPHDPAPKGKIVIRGEEKPHQSSNIRMKFDIENPPKKKGWGKEALFLYIEKIRENYGGNINIPVYKTEVIEVGKSDKVSFKNFEIGVQNLCDGEFYQSVRLRLYSWERNGKHIRLAEGLLNLDEALRKEGVSSIKLDLTDNAKERKKDLPSLLVMEQINLIARPSFLDFIKNGCELAFTVAVDFTASNGNPRDMHSLHYINRHGHGQGASGIDFRSNQYAQAIMGVGEVLEAYDTDKKFPVFGFGAKLRNGVSHCFALNGNENSPEVTGVQEILNVYCDAIQRYTLAGPTYFSEIIQRTAVISEHCNQSSQKYNVLLILTDGIINDMHQTIESIVQASTLPLSILIVGIGDADFTNMDVLDGDDTRLRTARGKLADRDIVQFVEFRKFIDKRTGHIDRYALARDLLDEIPGQLVSYMTSRNIGPMTSPSAPMNL